MHHRFLRTSVVFVFLLALLILPEAGPTAFVAARQPDVAGPHTAPQIEQPPAYTYATGTIAVGASYVTVVTRFASTTSRILLTVDTTAWPGNDVALPGIRIIDHGNGYFKVGTLDGSLAPAPSGIPFNYVIFNATTIGSNAFVGTAKIPANTHNVGVNLGPTTSSSTILLTVDTTGSSGSVSGVKVNNHGAGFFTVTTLDLRNPPIDLTFNYYVNTSTDCFSACHATIPSGVYNVGLSNFYVAKPSGIFLTVDATTIPNDVSLAGVKVNNHGSGFFTISTDRLSLAPSTGITFNWVFFQAPAYWEEFGPTALSGKSWTAAVDSVDFLTQYIGSTMGGVWKTTNGGDTWSSAWVGQRQATIMHLAWLPGSRTNLYALGYDGTVYLTQNAGDAWTTLASPAPFNASGAGYYGDSGTIAVPTSGLPLVCSDVGLYQYNIFVPGNWPLFGPDSVAHACNDIVLGPDGIYVSFRDIGVYRRNSLDLTWHQIKTPIDGNPRPARIALGPHNIVLNYDCEIFVNPDRTTLSGPNPNSTWQDKGHICTTAQAGYATSAAVSPTNDNHFIVTGNDVWLTTNGGSSWSHPGVGQDDHQTVFFDDSHVLLATDNGPRLSLDGGNTWLQALTTSIFTDGPPIKEYYDISVTQQDQFGRVMVGGNAQDSGPIVMAGSHSGFYVTGGEIGLAAIAARPLNTVNGDGTRVSSFRVYSTDSSAQVDPTSQLRMYACTFDLPGPGYPTPPGAEEGTYPLPSDKTGTACSGGQGVLFPVIPTAIGVSPVARGDVLVGLQSGALYRSITNSDGKQYQVLLAAPATPDPITAIYMNGTEDYAFVGYQSGIIQRIKLPFSTTPAVDVTTQPVHAAVTTFTGRPSFSEVYVAYAQSVWRSDTNGSPSGSNPAWTNITGNVDTANLAIVGLVRDPNHPVVYLATGHTSWYGAFGGNPMVYQSPTPATGTWTAVGQGLPNGVPITGIGIAADQALYLSTQGRGIWWRRDVTSIPPNSGVNSPAAGMSDTEIRSIFVTTCSYPTGWKNINLLDFKLAMNLGPGDGEPLALWVEFDQNANLIRFYDPDSGTWSSGTAGANVRLHSRFADLDLSNTIVHGFGPTDPTVQITWSVIFHQPASGTPLQQYLKVADDFGSSTGWDKVGTWSVHNGSTVELPLILH